MTLQTRRSGFLRCSPYCRLLILTASILSALACGATPAEQSHPPVRSYEVRGLVRQVKTLADSTTQISIHHEAIADFVGFQGEVEPMKSMTMPFTLAPGVTPEGIEAGSKILFELTVDWSAAEPALITRLESLPADMVLVFETAR